MDRSFEGSRVPRDLPWLVTLISLNIRCKFSSIVFIKNKKKTSVEVVKKQ